MKFELRNATLDDVDTLTALIDASVRRLQTNEYTQRQLEGALESVYGVDTQLIKDGTYFVAQTTVDDSNSVGKPEGKRDDFTGTTIVGCGGWSKRKTLYGADHFTHREDDLLDPELAPAKIRAFFIHPDWARQGIGTMILERCEQAALECGFKSFEMGATLTGIPMYSARGYTVLEKLVVPLANGESLAIARMSKSATEHLSQT